MQFKTTLKTEMSSKDVIYSLLRASRKHTAKKQTGWVCDEYKFLILFKNLQ